jgi:hypothetical protein
LRLIATQVFTEIWNMKRRASSPERHMSHRTAKFVSAIFASVLAGTPLATISHSAPDAADSCISRPKGAPPQGRHWYYRIDRTTKRSCWYIGDQKDELSRAAPETSSPPANSVSPPVSPTKNAIAQRSIANARAELPLPQTRVEQETNVFSGPRPPATAEDATSPENNRRANAGGANAQRSIVASRWPEPSGVSSSANAGPPTGNSVANVQSNSEAALPAAVAAVTLAAADPSSQRSSGSIQQLLIVIVGALSVAGLIGSAIFRFGGARRTNRRGVSGDRRTIWDSINTDRPPSPIYAGSNAAMPKADIPREPRAADDPNERMAQMLARLARSAAT